MGLFHARFPAPLDRTLPALPPLETCNPAGMREENDHDYPDEQDHLLDSQVPPPRAAREGGEAGPQGEEARYPALRDQRPGRSGEAVDPRDGRPRRSHVLHP
ncbi:hypothetical protein HALA3H3_p40013 [Halomonas sp. A3H3]|nr:hypothetical protein HALA3H3_p40013 [Halomonas sp. A3H3]